MVRPDQVSLGVLVHAVPRDVVDEAVAVCGVREKRSDGKLPAHVITYLTLALCRSPEEVLANARTDRDQGMVQVDTIPGAARTSRRDVRRWSWLARPAFPMPGRGTPRSRWRRPARRSEDRGCV